MGVLQAGLLDREPSCQRAVLHLLIELLKFAILDPGLPSSRLVSININRIIFGSGYTDSVVYSLHPFICKWSSVTKWTKRPSDVRTPDPSAILVVSGNPLSHGSLPHVTYWDLIWFCIILSFRTVVGASLSCSEP